MNNNKPSRVFVKMFNKALDLQSINNFSEAINIYEKLYATNKDEYALNINLGNCYYAINKYHKAAEIFHKLHEKHPNNITVLNLCGLTYLQLNLINLASQFFKKIVNLDPKNIEAWVNLTHTSNMLMDNTETLYYATQALSLNPSEARLHNNLGSALQQFHKYKEALTCYETAQILDPDDINSLCNIASVLDKIGNKKASIDTFEDVISKLDGRTNEINEIYYRMSFPLLALGQLKRGWECYEYGWNINDVRSRNPKREFKKPRWNGEKIIGKRLLVWREQGLGDEIMFFSLLKYVLPLCDEVIIECTERLETLFRRSFPTCTVRADHLSNSLLAPYLEDFDFQIPVGSLCSLFKTDISRYPASYGYLFPEEERKNDFKRKLSKYSNEKFVGISWRSGNLKIERNIHYTKLSDWADLLRTPNVTFVNLQYGDCGHELKFIKDQIGIEIVDFPDLDIKNDLESLAGLICNLDFVISVSTFASCFAPALGIKTKMLIHDSWDLLGNKGKYDSPWFSNVELYLSPTIDTPLSDMINNIDLER